MQKEVALFVDNFKINFGKKMICCLLNKKLMQEKKKIKRFLMKSKSVFSQEKSNK
jgi:hypothetical protein